MKHPKLIVLTREILGKKVKRLRRDGFMPANIYGNNIASTPVQVKLDEFRKIFKEVGETGIIDVEAEGTLRPVLIKNLQMDVRSHTPLHADFYQVNLKEKIKAMIPLIVTGEAKAVTDKVGLVLQTLSEVEVEALPEELPDQIDVNVENLASLDEHITVEQLSVPSGVTILTDPSQTVVKISELTAPEPEPEPEVAAAEATEGEAAEETAPTEAPATEQPAKSE